MSKTKHKVKFKNYNCIVEKEKYYNDRVALSLSEEKTKEPVLTATVNVVEYEMDKEYGEKYAFIKNYSENDGVLKALEDAGIIRDTGLEWPVGFASANLVEVLI